MSPTTPPWGDDAETTAVVTPTTSWPIRGSCAVCGSAFPQQGRGTYCSHACRQVAYRWRRSAARRVTPQQHALLDIVYECSQCEQRYLGERRCPDCNLFCRRVDIGGACPSCEEIVALGDLARSGRPLLPPTGAQVATTE